MTLSASQLARCPSKPYCDSGCLKAILFSNIFSLFYRYSLISLYSPLLFFHVFTRPKKQEKYTVYLVLSKSGNLTLVKNCNFPTKLAPATTLELWGFVMVWFASSMISSVHKYYHSLESWYLQKFHPFCALCSLWSIWALHFLPWIGFDQETHDFKVVRTTYW